MQEHVRSLDDYLADPTPFLVTSEIIDAKLEGYAGTFDLDDVVIVYSHTHGVRSVPGDHLGGLVLDDPGTGAQPDGWYAWSEYADRILDLPARTVVILTMSCFSGGLVNYLENHAASRARWEDRASQGRDFLVITSQNATSESSPRPIDGTVINPFTYAVVKAFEGAADGYRSGEDSVEPDGVMTLEELVSFVVDETRKHTSVQDAENDPDPQVTGSYRSETVLFDFGL